MALAEYSRLLETYPSLGYEVLILPKVGVSERADFILTLYRWNPWIVQSPNHLFRGRSVEQLGRLLIVENRHENDVHIGVPQSLGDRGPARKSGSRQTCRTGCGPGGRAEPRDTGLPRRWPGRLAGGYDTARKIASAGTAQCDMARWHRRGTARLGAGLFRTAPTRLRCARSRAPTSTRRSALAPPIRSAVQPRTAAVRATSRRWSGAASVRPM